MKRVALLSATLLLVLIGVRYYQKINTHPTGPDVKPEFQVVVTPVPEKKPEVVKPQTQKTATKKSITSPPLGRDASLTAQSLQDPDAFIPMTEDGGILIGQATVFVEDEVIVSHGDLIVADLKDLKKIQESGEPLILPAPKFWPNGKVPFQIAPELQGTDEERAVKMAIEEYAKKTPIRFVARVPEDKNYVIFSQGTENCLSNLGMIGGAQKILLAVGCDKGKVIHEMMHTLGFLHEQNREDRDKHLMVLWQNIDEEFHLQFKKIKSSNQKILQTGFDFTSIMLYPPEAFSITPGDYAMVNAEGSPYPVNRHSLSTKDIERIKIIYAPKNE
ncbi:MAG: hypothetical protein EP319_13400 [Deltaproteobacteria bacterium]|nr:MAG: hypothetical protein EP319_13400 [Deltaproteobacteria bacterium]